MNPFEERRNKRNQLFKGLATPYRAIVEDDLVKSWITKAWKEPPMSWTMKYPDKEAQLIYERFLQLKNGLEYLLSEVDHPYYKKAVPKIEKGLAEVKKALTYFEEKEDVETEVRIFKNYDYDLSAPDIQEGLTERCLKEIKEISKKYTRKGSKFVLQKAFECSFCKFEINEGKKEEIGSWETLRNRLKDNHPDIYKKTHKQ
ncbi:hypothetical protein [Halalkalibaculum sp. DA384]|uniref:hypothetical protein n=1 Tax=Halalkalibaculum sp. DA384 TaxID=3373606 RepID=UPI0037548D40